MRPSIKILLLVSISLLAARANAQNDYIMCHMHSFTDDHSSKPKQVQSDHQVIINNDTNKDVKYSVIYQTKIDKQIVHTNDMDITLRPFGTFSDDKLLSTNIVFKDKKKHDASCSTWIKKVGEDSKVINGGGSIIIK